MKKLITVIAILVCIVLLSRCNSNEPNEEINFTPDETVNTIVQENEEETQEEKEEYSFEYTSVHFTHSPNEQVNIDITYPQFKDEKFSELNSKIDEFAKTNFKELLSSDDENVELTLKETYEVESASIDLISISSSGELTKKDAAYPSKLMSSLNINPIDYRKFKISEFIDITDEFVTFFRNAVEAEAELSVYLSSFENNRIKEMLQDSKIYFEEENVVIILSVPHAIGDYVEIKISNDDIEPYKKAVV